MPISVSDRGRPGATLAVGLALAASLVLLAGTPGAGQAQQTPAAEPTQAVPPAAPVTLLPPPPAAPIVLPAEPQLEPKAVELLQAMSDHLAAARSMTFTAVATYESPAVTGQPLAYTTRSEVTLERPDKLRVITPADGQPSEFYYDGTTMMAYAPGPEFAAVADAPATIDAMLRAIYDLAGTYFPFTDVIVADPWGDLAPALRLAFVIGQSRVVGGTLTDMVAIADDTTQAQIWIGAEDNLPRMIRATFFGEPGNFRHQVEFSDWRLDPTIPPGSFTSANATKAARIEFASPQSALSQQP